VTRDGYTLSEESKPGGGALPAPPDGAAVNAAWPAPADGPGGARGLLYRLLDRLLAPRFAAQRDFNAKQVQLDNAVLAYLQLRFAAAHGNYDRVLGLLGRRLDEIDERHRRLEAEVQAHVRDLARRIDLVLEESTRGGPARDGALEELRARLARLEESLARRDG
jgi:hypothetical protein